ncbi:MAG: hypothetical protein ACOC1J_00245 [Prolixibacteraceae bacterium]
MKKFTLISLLIACTFFLHAQKVALHNTSGVQIFTGVDGFLEACNSAVSGDTIYLAGGGFSSPGTIDKRLLIFGAGHYPDSTAVTSKTIINGYINLTENADGFHIEGVDITGNFTTQTNHAVDHIKIKYCRIQGVLRISGDQSNPAINLMLANSVITGKVELPNAQNAGIFNSLFNGEISGTYGNLFQNNIFLLNNKSNLTYKYTLIGNNNTLENNIFLRTQDREISGTSNIIKNNITPKTDPFWGTTPVASGNYTGVEVTTIFVNQTGNVFDYTHNYHLQAPEAYPGTDGAEVGIYGGTHTYKEGAVPSNPHFVIGNIAPQSDAEGKLNIEIKVTAQDR